MYGFGSKKALIEDFASKALTEHSVVVINGYLQSINLKQVHILDFRAICYSFILDYRRVRIYGF